MPSGTCQFCGCTEAVCAWADEAQTICTACLPRMENASLLELVVAEIGRLAGGPLLKIEISTVEAFMLLGQLQLALRHPENVGPSADVASDLVELLADYISDGPATAEIVRRGWEQEFDEPHGEAVQVPMFPGENVSPGGIYF